jgi:3-deoxy-D-manno-octulosonic acid kinase
VAAVYVRHGATYRADLITARIPDAETLAERVHRGEADETLWRRVGATIGRFHAAGLDHADLNARNVLIAGGDVFLLDLDRGVLRPPGSWSRRNLARLERSLLRLHQREAAPAPRAADRQALLAGYASAGSE